MSGQVEGAKGSGERAGAGAGSPSTPQEAPLALKQCCAQLYESEIARWLLGDSLHPGGLGLTARLGELLRLDARSLVLDVACGAGTSALFLAERFGCQVLGVDFSAANVERARAAARARGMDARVRFRQADAEALPVADESFDALICECAYCTFPDKLRAASEFARVLRAAGRLGLSDLTRAELLPETLSGLLAWIACIADARPLQQYLEDLGSAGFEVEPPELHDEALRELVRQVQGRLLAVELLSGLKRVALPQLDLAGAKRLAREAAQAIERGALGYALIVATRPAPRRLCPAVLLD